MSTENQVVDRRTREWRNRDGADSYESAGEVLSWEEPESNDEIRICRAIYWLSHQTERLTNLLLSHHELPEKFTLIRALMLMTVNQGDGSGGMVRMSEVAIRVGVTPRTVTTIVDALERENYLKRVPDPDDRRATFLTLTEEGVHLMPTIYRAMDAVGEEMLLPLSERERETLLTMLLKLIDDDELI